MNSRISSRLEYWNSSITVNCWTLPKAASEKTQSLCRFISKRKRWSGFESFLSNFIARTLKVWVWETRPAANKLFFSFRSDQRIPVAYAFLSFFHHSFCARTAVGTCGLRKQESGHEKADPHSAAEGTALEDASSPGITRKQYIKQTNTHISKPTLTPSGYFARL